MRSTRYALYLLPLLMLIVPAVRAQSVVTVTLPDVSAEPGSIVQLPVELSDVTGLDVTAFSIWMTYDPAVIRVTEVTIGPLAFSAGPEAGEPLVNIGPGGVLEAGEVRVTHATGGRPLVGSGILFTYELEFLDVGDAAITFTRFRLNEGNPAVQIVGGSANVNNRPFTSDVSLALDEDSDGDVILTATDPDGDDLAFEVVTGPGNGSVTIEGATATYTPKANFNGSDQFTFRAFDGVDYSNTSTARITVRPVNDPPVFVHELGELRVHEGQVVTYAYSATDQEGNPVSFRLVAAPEGATIGSATGIFSWTPTTAQAGVHVVQVGASDGFAETLSVEAVITVVDALLYDGTLSPAHLVDPVLSAGHGAVSLAYVPEDGKLILDGRFSDLTSGRNGARVHLGALGSDGQEVLPLIVAEDSQNPGSRNGRIAPSVNSIDISLLSSASGLSVEEIVAALDAGEVYVLVRSLTHQIGELRAQLRPMDTNQAPETGVMDIGSSVSVQGDPAAEALTATWSESVDPNGDAVRHVVGFWADPALTEPVLLADGGDFQGSWTVADLARLYDTVSGGQPGSIAVGGTESVYAAVLATDGSDIATSFAYQVDLIRGLVTANEADALVPDAFLLRGNYPNPFNPTTTIQFDLPAPADVEVHVTDLLGRVALTVPSQPMEAGVRRMIPIEASALASGIYIYRITARAAQTVHVATGTMTLLK